MTSVIESAWAVWGNGLPVLSPQQSLDCDSQQHGCKGGWTGKNMDYLTKNGLESESAYPYHGVQGRCAYNRNQVVAKIASHAYATSKSNPNEDEMAANLMAYGPITISVNANANWHRYKTGIMSSGDCSSNPRDLNHAISLVGWATDPKTHSKYWIGRNQWTSQWGDKGIHHHRFKHKTKTITAPNRPSLRFRHPCHQHWSGTINSSCCVAFST